MEWEVACDEANVIRILFEQLLHHGERRAAVFTFRVKELDENDAGIVRTLSGTIVTDESFVGHGWRCSGRRRTRRLDVFRGLLTVSACDGQEHREQQNAENGTSDDGDIRITELAPTSFHGLIEYFPGALALIPAMRSDCAVRSGNEMSAPEGRASSAGVRQRLPVPQSATSQAATTITRSAAPRPAPTVANRLSR